jgi:hypothetical protein
MIAICLFSAVAAQLYKYPVYDSLLRLPSFTPVAVAEAEDSLIVLGNSAGKAVLKRLTKDKVVWSRVLTSSNNSTAVSLAGSSPIRVAVNVDWQVVEALPTAKPGTPRTGQVHGLLLEISISDGVVQSAVWAFDCLSEVSPISAFQANSRAYYVAGKCQSYYLHALSWMQPLPDPPAAIASTQSSVYVTQTSSSIVYVSRYSSAGSFIWKVPVSLPSGAQAALAVYTDVFYLSEYFAVCSNNTLVVLSQIGELVWTAVVPADFECISIQLMPGQGFLVAGNLKSSLYSYVYTSNPVLALVWFGFAGNKLAYRIYDAGNSAKLKGVVFTDRLSVVVDSASAFYQEASPPQQPSAIVFVAQSPFDLAQCASVCSSCFDTGRTGCFSCKTYEESKFACGECPADCQACSSMTECTSCKPSYSLHGGSCNLDLNCPAGQYTDAGLKACAACPSSCASCTGPDLSQCVTCAPTLSFNDGFCLAKCPTYRYSEAGVCKDCSPTCQRCDGSGPERCTLCPDKTYLYQGKCTAACPAATFLESGKCVQCHSSCSTCTGSLPSSCIDCKAGLIKFQQLCLEKCPTGYYFDSTSCKQTPVCPPKTYFDLTQCAPCSPNCAECFGLSADECKSCAGDFFLKGSSCTELRGNCTHEQFLSGNNTCTDCPAPCSACIAADRCTACSDSSLLYEAACVDDCPLSTFVNSTVCVNCPDGCLSCNSSACSRCLEGWLYDAGKCLKHCPVGKFEVDEGCTECAEGCSQCTNSTVCSECTSQYFLSNSSCLECPYPCANCSSASSCDTCLPDFFKSNDACLQQCPRLAGPLQGVCERCPVRCEECAEGYCSKCALDSRSKGRYSAVEGTCTLNLTCAEGWSLDNEECTTEMSSVQEFLYFLASQLWSN